jgi:hypothetical protein
MLAADPFRPGLAPAVSTRQMWPLLVLLASCLFFTDVLVRRVAIDLKWLGRALLGLLARRGRSATPTETDPRLERLRARKSDVDEVIAQRRAAALLSQSSMESESEPPRAPATTPPPSSTGTPATLTPTAPSQEDDTYTSRLLKAKQQLWKDQ